MGCMEHTCTSCGWWTVNDDPRQPDTCPECGGETRPSCDEPMRGPEYGDDPEDCEAED